MNTKLIASVAIVVALALVISPLVMNGDVLAKHKSNKSNQQIHQHQSNHQSSNVVSGGDSALNGNNINLQFQDNHGSNVAGQS